MACRVVPHPKQQPAILGRTTGNSPPTDASGLAETQGFQPTVTRAACDDRVRHLRERMARTSRAVGLKPACLHTHVHTQNGPQHILNGTWTTIAGNRVY
jgi:hypothetical protein